MIGTYQSAKVNTLDKKKTFSNIDIDSIILSYNYEKPVELQILCDNSFASRVFIYIETVQFY